MADPFPLPPDLLAWYYQTFVPDPQRGYALMTPPGGRHKYARRNQPLDLSQVEQALMGGSRRLEIDGAWQTIPTSIAVTPEHRDGWALSAVVEVDAGGRAALDRVLNICQSYNLWAFAQVSQSEDHDGGHVYIPTSDPLPTSLLHDLAARIQAQAQVKGEAYPNNRDLRLPLMAHLRAPGGPGRFPLLLPCGGEISATDPAQALTNLQAAWTPNAPEKLTQVVGDLPRPTPIQPQRLHKSKVNPQNSASVIHWYSDNFSLTEVLESVGVDGADRAGAFTCPWHDDKNPSLVLWQHPRRGLVCRCYSQHSNCPAADAPYLDTFNLYCLIHKLPASEAVKRLVDEYQLGRRRELKIEPAPAAQVETATNPDPYATHQQAITDARACLADALIAGAQRVGSVTVIRAVPGLGKTHQAAQLADTLHSQGKTVAVVTASHKHAAEEWAPRLTSPFVWRSRLTLCTCYEKEKLTRWSQLGYVLPPCEPGCPYRRQHEDRHGHVAIYQHNHLHLDGGKLLNGADVVIIDENPLNALLEEHTTTQDDLRRLGGRLASDDPAQPLIWALWKVAEANRAKGLTLAGETLLTAIQRTLGERQLAAIMEQTKTSKSANTHPIVDPELEDHRLTPQFFGSLVAALARDTEPTEAKRNPLVSFGWDGNAYRFTWYERHILLKHGTEKLIKPAVLVLDGSAHPLITSELYKPWPVNLVEIDTPLAPGVQIIQIPTPVSTRRIVKDQDVLDRLTRSVAVVCNHLGVTLDGGISYLGAVKHFATILGGTWLHYGGQRGSNALMQAHTIAIVASPTAPPGAILRKTRALFCDAGPIDQTAERVTVGAYRYKDERLEAFNQLHGPEELRQAAHRCRPILSTSPTMLLVFTPWNLPALGFTPSQTVTELPHNNSTSARLAERAYLEQRCLADSGGRIVQVQENRQIQNAMKNTTRPGETRSSRPPLLNLPKKLHPPANLGGAPTQIAHKPPTAKAAASPPLSARSAAVEISTADQEFISLLIEQAREEGVRLVLDRGCVQCQPYHYGIAVAVADCEEALRQLLPML